MKKSKSIGNIFPREYVYLKGIKNLCGINFVNFVNLDYFLKSKPLHYLRILIMRKNKSTHFFWFQINMIVKETCK